MAVAGGDMGKFQGAALSCVNAPTLWGGGFLCWCLESPSRSYLWAGCASVRDRGPCAPSPPTAHTRSFLQHVLGVFIWPLPARCKRAPGTVTLFWWVLDVACEQMSLRATPCDRKCWRGLGAVSIGPPAWHSHCSAFSGVIVPRTRHGCQGVCIQRDGREAGKRAAR